MYKRVVYAGHQFTIYPLNCEKLNPQYKLNTTHVGRCIWSGQLYAVCCFEFKFGSPLCVNRLTDTRLSQPASKMKKKKNNRHTNDTKKNSAAYGAANQK